MRLKLVRIQGYKRFAALSKLDTRGPLIAIVGPNEAGKTSLLEAMVHVSSRQPFDAREHTRGTEIDNEKYVVVAEFSLEPEDRELLGDLVPEGVDLTYGHYCYSEGNSKYSVEPHLPRDLTPRDQAASALRQALQDGWLEPLDEPDDDGEEGDEPRLFERADELVDALASRDDWLSQDVRQKLAELRDRLQREVPEDAEAARDDLVEVLARTAEFENAKTPQELVRDVLSPRIPQFLLFDESHRALDTEYAWADHPTPPPALANLFALAEADYDTFRGHAEADDRPTMETLQEAANKELDEAFKAWHQADLHVTFSADHRALQLLVRDRATAQRTRLDERSAGLRSFVALIAFCARYGGNVRPILMVDESETHLTTADKPTWCGYSSANR